MEKDKSHLTPQQELLASVRQGATVHLAHQQGTFERPAGLIMPDVRLATHIHHDDEAAIQQVRHEECEAEIWTSHMNNIQTAAEFANLLTVMGSWIEGLSGVVSSYHFEQFGVQASSLAETAFSKSTQFAHIEPEAIPLIAEAWSALMPKRSTNPIVHRMHMKFDTIESRYVSEATITKRGIQDTAPASLQLLSALTDVEVVNPDFWAKNLEVLGEHSNFDFVEVTYERLLQEKPILGEKGGHGRLNKIAEKVIRYALHRHSRDPKRQSNNAQKISEFISTEGTVTFDRIIALANNILHQKDDGQPKLQNAASSIPTAFGLLLEATRKDSSQDQQQEDEMFIGIVNEVLILADQRAETIPRTMGALAAMFPDATSQQIAELLKEDSSTSRSRLARQYRIAKMQVNKTSNLDWRATTKSRGGLLT